MGRVSRRLRFAVGNVACCLWLVACNSMLGIREPSDHLLGVAGQPAADGGGQGGAGRVASKDAGDESDGGTGTGSQLAPSLHAWADWPMPNPASTKLPNTSLYKKVASGVLEDQVTGLQWQVMPDAKRHGWEEANHYCAQLTLDGGGFRLPSRIELLSLIDFTQTSPTIDSAAFPNTTAERFWSSSPFIEQPASAWGVNFGFTVAFVFKDDVAKTCRVRCVRSPSSAPAASPSPWKAAGSLTSDASATLTWQRSAPQATYTFVDAQRYCAQLTLSGTGWRLPTIKELHTLVDEKHKTPAIDQSAFPDTALDYYWSSSQVANFKGAAWSVEFAHGFDGFYDADTMQHVRCVR